MVYPTPFKKTLIKHEVWSLVHTWCVLFKCINVPASVYKKQDKGLGPTQCVTTSNFRCVWTRHNVLVSYPTNQFVLLFSWLLLTKLLLKFFRRHLWKHYLPATSFAVGKINTECSSHLVEDAEQKHENIFVKYYWGQLSFCEALLTFVKPSFELLDVEWHFCEFEANYHFPP